MLQQFQPVFSLGWGNIFFCLVISVVGRKFHQRYNQRFNFSADLIYSFMAPFTRIRNTFKVLLCASLCWAAISHSIHAQLPDNSIAPDFSVTDIEGNTHHLYGYLDQGYTVVLKVFATWSGPDWSYQNSGALQNLYLNEGVSNGGDVIVLAIEGDNQTTVSDLLGAGGNTQGDWTAGVDYPFIDYSAILNLYQIAYYPTIFKICPNRLVNEIGQLSYEELLVELESCVQYADDAFLVQYTGDLASCDSFDVSVDLFNGGLNTIQNGVFTLSGAVDATVPWSGNIQSYEMLNVTLGSFTLSDEPLTITFSSANDQNPNNNSLQPVINTAVQPVSGNLNISGQFDNWPEEFSWEVYELETAMPVAAGSGANFSDQAMFTQFFEIASDGCYVLQINDQYGDGLNGSVWEGVGSIDGNFSVFSEGACAPLFEYDGSYFYESLFIPLLVDADFPTETIAYGCTNASACNYDAQATCDDGSCIVIGGSCDDGDNSTVFDTMGNDCVCAGVPGFGSCSDYFGDFDFNFNGAYVTTDNIPNIPSAVVNESYNIVLSLNFTLQGSPVAALVDEVNYWNGSNYVPLEELGLNWSCLTDDCLSPQSSYCIGLSGVPNLSGSFPLQIELNIDFFINLNIDYYTLNVNDYCADPAACNFGMFTSCSFLEDPTIIGNPNITPFNTFSYIVPEGDYSIQWSAENGSIVSGQGTNAVQIMWLENGPYVVTVTLTNGVGCIVESFFIATNNSCNISVAIGTSNDALCPGETTTLVATTGAVNPSFQWYMNGQAIADATGATHEASDEGEYQVMVSIQECSAVSSSLFISEVEVSNVPVIEYLISNPECGDGVAILSFNSDDFNSYVWSTGGLNATISVNESGDYFVSAVDESGCVVVSESVSINFALIEPVPICLVTVDSETGFNTIAWEPETSDLINAYAVYKETSIANDYEVIGSVPYGQDGVFVDENSNSAVQASRYKIGVVDICEVTSILSPAHKTVHLTSNLGLGNSINLIWSHYEGAEFGSYVIYRGDSEDNLTPLATIASNLNSYTDLLPILDGYYMIEVEGISCDPSRDLITSRSNIISLNETAVLEHDAWQCVLFPNPAQNHLNLSLSTNWIGAQFTLFDLQGRIVRSGAIDQTEIHIQTSDLSNGRYTMRLSAMEYVRSVPVTICK